MLAFIEFIFYQNQLKYGCGIKKEKKIPESQNHRVAELKSHKITELQSFF